MKINFKLFFILVGLTVIFSSCRTSAPRLDYQALARDSKRGTDCSGMVYQIYRKVYRIQVPRNTEELKNKSNKVAKRNLKEGDLVFFSSNRSRKRVAHVGIYLKSGKFIHSSTSRGVIVSRLNEDYYLRHWISGGRIR